MRRGRAGGVENRRRKCERNWLFNLYLVSLVVYIYQVYSHVRSDAENPGKLRNIYNYRVGSGLSVLFNESQRCECERGEINGGLSAARILA